MAPTSDQIVITVMIHSVSAKWGLAPVPILSYTWSQELQFRAIDVILGVTDNEWH